MSFLVGAIAMLGLGAAFGAWTARAGYRRAVAAALVAMAMMQVAIAWAAVRSPIPAVLALAVFAIAASGLSYLRRGNARDVLLVGGSLAGVQGVAPVGGLLAALLVPLLAGMAKPPGSVARQSGLYLLLFFLPVLAAIGLSCFARVGHAVPAATFHLFPPSALPRHGSPSHIVRAVLTGAALAVIAPAAIATALQQRKSEGLAVFPLLVGMGLVVANLVAVALGAIRNPAAMMAPLAAASLLAICAWPRARATPALAAMACVLGLAAAYALAAVPYAWAL